VLHAYIDESGIHDGAKFCVLGGYVGSVKQWDRFNRIWTTDAENPPFHANRFFACDDAGQRVRPHLGWTDERAARYVGRLLDAIATVSIKPVGCFVDVEAFQSFTEAQRTYLTGGYMDATSKRWEFKGAPTKPYYLAFMKTLMHGLDANTVPGWKTHFTFDRQKEMAPLAVQLYEHIAQTQPPRYSAKMGRIEFRGHEDAGPLQAADLLVYAWHRRLTRGRVGSKRIEDALAVLVSKSDTMVSFSREAMEKVLRLRPPTPGELRQI
jgi:hypothetical protein